MEDLYPTRGTTGTLIERQDPVVCWQSAGNLPPSDRERLERFERDGYLFAPGLFPAAVTGSLLGEAERLRALAVQDKPENAFFESGTNTLRSLFAVHQACETFAAVCEDARILALVRAILGDDVYVHQSRLNYKPAFCGREFYWHSDFETWHAEDGMPRMRALSLSISLTPTLATNGPLMIVPGSHRTFISCAGATPADHFRESLVKQRVGTPDEATVERFARSRGIKAPTGAAGSAVFFDCNVLHGSNGNITPFPRTNLFVVYNAVSNALEPPFAASAPRPEFVGARAHVEALPRRAKR